MQTGPAPACGMPIIWSNTTNTMWIPMITASTPRVPYIHYTFQIPRVNRSGNYIIKVYRGRDESKTLLTRRFMVYDNQVALGASRGTTQQK